MSRFRNMKQLQLLVCLIVTLIGGTQAEAQTIGTISVADVVYSTDNNEFRSGDDLVSSITSGLNTALTKSRKFNVLSYAELQKRLDDQGRTLKGYYDNAYANDSYDQTGLDYIVTVDIVDFDVLKQKRGNSETAVSVVDLNFKLYGVADITEDHIDSVSVQVATKVRTNNEGQLQAVIDSSVKKAVDQLVDKMISGLFPIRVMKISEEGAITLNYGEGLLAPGDTIMIYPKGVDIKLDETGEPIGEAIATLQVISAERKFSIAQPLDGQELLQKGQQGVLLRTNS